MEDDEEKAISRALEKMKMNSHPDAKFQQVFFIESPEEEIASAARSAAISKQSP